MPIRIDAKDLVDFFIADVKESRWIPHRPFREAEAGCQHFQLRFVGEQFPKLRRFRAKCELARRAVCLHPGKGETGENERGCDMAKSGHLQLSRLNGVLYPNQWKSTEDNAHRPQ